MILSFSSRKVRRLCEQHEELAALYGDQAARLLQARLADLVAAETLQDIVVGELYEQPWRVFTFQIGIGFKIMFKVINTSCIRLASGQSDYATIDRILIEGIEHGAGA